MLTEHIQKVVEHVRATDAPFKGLYHGGLNVFPIPFFGDLTSANILTIGINPAWTEFEDRCWPTTHPTPEYLELRLRNYFHLKSPPPHPWFFRWEEALNRLDCSSYRTNAAHLDLSPRATEFMSEVPADSFQSMIAEDIGLFFETLSLCSRAKVLLIAGCVTNEFYIDEFVAKQASKHEFELVGDRKKLLGEAKVAHYLLRNKRKEWPVFFCSVGPSAKKSFQLPQRVVENREKLLSHLNCACVTNN